jgi:membrane-bound lytic murein transglycosylase D
MKGRFGLLVFLLVGWGMWGCGSANKGAAISNPPGTERHPVPAVAKEADDEVGKLIEQARQHYFVGERELNLGHLEKAKAEFDASLDILMEYQGKNEPDSRVEQTIDELQDKIFDHEMAALKEGDGFTQRPLEPALIDELKNIDTFPPADQQTKQEVEEELKTASYGIPVEVNDTVLSFIRIFQNARRKEFVGGLIRSGRYLDRMKAIFREEGVPEDLVYTVLIESSFKSNAYSRARAKGFWQFISGTARRYHLKMDWWVDERSDFERSTRAAARYLKDLYGMFDDWYLTLAGYNAGENTIINGMRRSGQDNFWDLCKTRYLRQETRNYVPAILASMIIARDPEKYGFTEDIEQPLQYDTVVVDYPIDLRLVAECTGTTLEEIKLLNPELNRLTTPPKADTYELRLPDRTRETFLAEIAAVPEDKRITWRKHEVKEGETLTSIAANYRVSVKSIAGVNSLDKDGKLVVGQKVVIPIGRSTSVAYRSSRSVADAPGKKRYYSVHSGDTLFWIANRYGVTVEQLRAWNGLSGSYIRPGQSLVVRYTPVKTASASDEGNGKKIIYHVRKGDTLYQIANSYNTDVNSLKRWNNLDSGDIMPGDRLTIYYK